MGLTPFGVKLDRWYESFVTPVSVAMEVYYTKPRDKLPLSAYARKHEGPPTNLLKIDVGDITELRFCTDICSRVLRVWDRYTVASAACLAPYVRYSQSSARCLISSEMWFCSIERLIPRHFKRTYFLHLHRPRNPSCTVWTSWPLKMDPTFFRNPWDRSFKGTA